MTIIEKLTIVELSDGTRIEGVIPIDRPREQSRISDVLNDASELFVRRDDEEQTYYVNKRFLRSVIPR
jgi:DNA mismatch repair ATPase MutL